METILRIHRPRALLKNVFDVSSPQWGIAHEDSGSFGLLEIDVEKIIFITPPRLRDREITQEKWLQKLYTKTEYILLGAQVGLSLRRKNTQHLLEYLRIEKGVAEMDFPGTVLFDPRGVQCVLRLWYQRGWNYCFWSKSWPTTCPSAVMLNEKNRGEENTPPVKATGDAK